MKGILLIIGAIIGSAIVLIGVYGGIIYGAVRIIKWAWQ